MLAWIRIPKGIALFAFFMPWLTVSCSGQPLAKASGIGLAFGKLDIASQIAGQMEKSPPINPLLMVAMLLIIAGLVVLFRKPAKSGLLVVGTSVLALTFTGLGMTRYSVGNMRTAIDPDHIDPLARAGSTMLHVQYEIGFWACILALLISAAMAFMVARQEAQSDLTVTDMPVPQPAPAPAPAPAPSDDTAPTPPDKG
jgi:hypothetical protein